MWQWDNFWELKEKKTFKLQERMKGWAYSERERESLIIEISYKSISLHKNRVLLHLHHCWHVTQHRGHKRVEISPHRTCAVLIQLTVYGDYLVEQACCNQNINNINTTIQYNNTVLTDTKAYSIKGHEIIRINCMSLLLIAHPTSRKLVSTKSTSHHIHSLGPLPLVPGL